MTGRQRTATTRFTCDVLVVGATAHGVAAALAARASGAQVLLTSAGCTLAEVVTTALPSEVDQLVSPRLEGVIREIAGLGGVHDGWLDPPITELVMNRLAGDQGIEVLYYAVPLRLVTAGDRAVGVLYGGKDGFFVVAAGAVVDATCGGVLYHNSGVAFEPAADRQVARTVYFQHAGEDLSGLPARVGDYALSIRRTWPTEAVVTMRTEVPAGSDLMPMELVRASRLAVAQVAEACVASVPGLREAVVSHTGHRLVCCTHARLAQPHSRHPELINVSGAGPWVRGDQDCATATLTRGGREAGLLASAQVLDIVETTAELPDPTVIETDVAVAGGGTGGAVAAIAAGRQGARCEVIEAGWFLGGIGTGGGIHYYYHGVPGGLQDEIDARTEQIADQMGSRQKVAGFSPEAKKIALEQMAAEAQVNCRYQTTVVEVVSEGNRVTGLLCVFPGQLLLVKAGAVVDASGDGDVCARAGASFTIGRETDRLNHAYSQSAGVFKGTKIGGTNFDAGFVDATDIVDLTRARRHAVGLYYPDQPFTPETRLLYIAPLLGLRQARQVIGDYVLSLDDQVHGREFDDVVAYGKCHYDNHAFDYENESDEAMFWCWVLGHWRRHMRHELPYRSLLPAGVDGLLIGSRAVSISHDASMLFRMQRDMQRIGEAAGTAAALAALAGVTPRELPVDQLQAALRESGALLDDWASALPPVEPPALVAELASEDPGLAAWQLYQQGDAAVPALRDGLASDDAETRWWSAATLAMLGQGDGYQTLVEALERRDETLPGDAVKQLKQYDGQRRAPRWVGALALLGRLGDPRATAAVRQVLEQPPADPDYLLAAVRAAARLGDREAVPALERWLEEEPPGLAQMQNSDTGQKGVSRDIRWQLDLAVTEALAELGVDASDQVDHYLHDERAYVRRYAELVLAAAPAARQGGGESQDAEAGVRARRAD